MSISVRPKHRAVTEFLFFEGCLGDEMGMRIQNADGQDAYCRGAVF
jgi:hypothetical protein